MSGPPPYTGWQQPEQLQGESRRRARHPRFALTEPVISEHVEQQSMNKVLTLAIAPAGRISMHGVCWFSVDQSNSHDAIPAIRVGRGLVSGVPDVLFLHQGRAYFIELKSRNGVLSDPQRSMAATLLLSGCRIGLARDVKEVMALLDEWNIPLTRNVQVGA